MESRQYIHMSANVLDKATDTITAFSGSWAFLCLHIVWFALWIISRIEPFPFGLLTMIVSLEAIFLSTLVMMSQNRQSTKDHKRDDLEAVEVDEIHQTLQLLKTINEQQLAILEDHKDLQQILARLDEMKGMQHVHPLRVRGGGGSKPIEIQKVVDPSILKAELEKNFGASSPPGE